MIELIPRHHSSSVRPIVDGSPVWVEVLRILAFALRQLVFRGIETSRSMQDIIVDGDLVRDLFLNRRPSGYRDVGVLA